MSAPKPAFDFEDWFYRRLSRYTPEGEERRPGTLTLSESDLLTDLVYDYCRYASTTEKQAKGICKQSIENAGCLKIDKRGYYLRGEPRIRYDERFRIVEE